MAKTQEELNALKEEVETLNNKFVELSDEKLEQVRGGEQILIKEKLIKEQKRAHAVEKRKMYDEMLKKGEITKYQYDILIHTEENGVELTDEELSSVAVGNVRLDPVGRNQPESDTRVDFELGR